jgi:3'-phosphoadenosine 5'-phosphosulfate sulfotransferase (PAPS reductase)/FAD synthetase
MNRPLREKIAYAIQRMRRMWNASRSKVRFVAFSTGKDSLAMMAMLYEAVESENEEPICLYSHHGLEFPENLHYLETIREHGFQIETVRPFLGYFDLMRRGIGFLTLYDPWCVPMSVGTGFLEWLQNRNLSSPRDAVMFRGMTGSEYGKKYHAEFETYRRLDLPCFNPMLGFTRDEVLQIIRERYGLPLNPL